MSDRTDIHLTFRRSLKLRFLIIVIGAVTLFSGAVAFLVIDQFSRLALLTVYHEGLLLSDVVESGIQQFVASEDIDSIQRYTDRLVQTRDVNDIEINIIRLTDPESSAIVVSNNRSNLKQTDEEEHAALLEALTRNEPFMEIEENVFDIDPDDDLTTYSDPDHPDHYMPTGYRLISITTPLESNSRGWGCINIELSLMYLDQKLDRIYLFGSIALMVGLLLLAGGLIRVLNHRFFDPLWNLADAMYRFGLGQPTQPKDVPARRDEIGVLTNEFGNMVKRLNDTEAMNRRYRDHLEELVQERTSELAQTQEATILCMASLAETRDPETGGHIRRTQNYIKVLAEHIRRDPRYAYALDETSVDLIFKSAPLHDIGKVGINDSILLKPGKLTFEEFETMKLHTVYGRDALQAAEESLGSNSFLRFAKEIAYTHQEKWDGSGYPEGLKGEEIPISGRLMAIADVYDALISKRVYKPAYSHQEAMAIIREGRGTHFDPGMVDAFVALEEEIKAIAREYADVSAE